jgi:hypothetical protein
MTRVAAVISERWRGTSRRVMPINYATTTVPTKEIYSKCAVDAKGRTLYDKMVEGNFLLGMGQEM